MAMPVDGARTHWGNVARQVRAQAAGEGWSRWRAVQEICTRTGVSQVAGYRLAAGWTLEKAARRLAELREPGETGSAVTVQMVCAWERGRVMPSVANVDLLCRLYRTRADRLGFAHDYTESVADAQTPAETGEPAGERAREELHAAGLRATPRLLASLASIRGSADSLLQPAPADPTDLDIWEARTQQRGREFLQKDGALTLGAALADFAALQRAMRTIAAPHTSPYYRRGSRLLGVLAGLVSICTVGLGEYEEAAGWFRTGRIAAYRSGDRILESWVMTHHAYALLLADQPEAALAQARAAQAVAGTDRCSTALWGPEVEVRALARMGCADEALAAARRAEDVFAHGYPYIETDTITGHGDGFLYWTKAIAQSASGDIGAAHGSFDAALRLCPASSGWPVLVHLDRAIALAREGDVAHATRAATDIVGAMPGWLQEGIGHSYVEQLLGTIPPRYRRLKCVTELRDVLTPTVS